jgi:hypothetical protein
MIYDENWRMQHPQLQAFMQANPNVWTWLEQWGEYDTQNQWHDAYWWHQNNRQWFYNNRPEWVSYDSQWRNQDGDYDSQRSWHDAYWWHRNNRDWFIAIIQNGYPTIRNGKTRMAPSTNSKDGTMVSGGTIKILAGSRVTIPRGSSRTRIGPIPRTCRIISSNKLSFSSNKQ